MRKTMSIGSDRADCSDDSGRCQPAALRGQSALPGTFAGQGVVEVVRSALAQPSRRFLAFGHMSALLTPQLLRQLEQFQLLAARRAKSSAKGERRSRARGQSVEFADYRNYVAGDDFRYLDWNLYGRLDRLFLKLYEEERELPVRIFLDCSESMTFGEPRKFDFARQVAAAVGYVALCGFDRVSVIPFPNAEFGVR